MRDRTCLPALQRVLRAAVMMAAAGGCSRVIDPADFTANVCSGGSYTPLSGVTLPAGYSWVALFEVPLGTSDPVSPQGRQAVASLGAPCAGAPDPAMCQTALAALDLREGWTVPNMGDVLPGRRTLVYTRGAEVGVARTLDRAAELLDPVDTAGEAAFLVSERGFQILCDGANVRPTATGFEVRARTGTGCGASSPIDHHVLAVNRAGRQTTVLTERVEDGNPNCAIGRRFEGFVAPGAGSPEDLGAWLAEMAALEAGAVQAFAVLRDELTDLGAPRALIAAAERSRKEEVRHARSVARLARRRGATVPRVPRAVRAKRSAFAIALENAVEGCVRETFGAAQAQWQAERAEAPDVRSALGPIAEEETRHAAFSWDLARWLEPKLTAPEREAVESARREAVAHLRAVLRTPHPEAAQREAGAPSPDEALRLCDALATSLWAA